MSLENRSKLNIFFAMFLFGTIGIFVRYINMPSSVIALARGVVGMSFLLLILMIRRRKLDWQAVKQNRIWLLFSSAALGFNWILLFEAYRYTSVAIGTLCYYMAPSLIILVSPLLLKEKLSAKKIVCLLASFVGMVCISGVLETGVPSTGELMGILLGLAAAVLYASVVLMNKQLHNIGSYDRTVMQLGVSAVILLPYCLTTVDFSGLQVTGLSFAMLLFVGIVHTGVTYLLYFGSLEQVKGQTAAIISYVDPVVAVLASVLILSETMTIVELLGAILILGAALVSEVQFKKRSASV